MSFADSVDVKIGATGAPETLAQLAAVRAEMQAMQGQSVAVKADTAALRTVKADATAAATAVRALSAEQIAVKADTTGLRTVKTDAMAAQTAAKALAAEKIAMQVDTSQIQGARQAIQGLEQDALGAGMALSKLAAPVALGAAVGGVTALAGSYQTLLTTTANNTTMATADIKLMDQTIRSLPSGNAAFGDLAAGFKNITDLGYSAAEAQAIATEASKAATEAGANQATTMLSGASVMKEYGASAAEASRYINTQAEAAKLGNSTMQQWAEGTRRATAVAANLGVPLQEVDAALISLTRHGFDTAQSSTQVAALLQHIIAPSQAAQKELGRLSRTTGIDLVTDFSLAGLQAKGLGGVLNDLARATAGNQDEIYKLIPAVRGGQAALVLAGQGAIDFKTALADLGQAMDGTLTPVEDGFARIQQTAGYQWGTFVKQLKLDAIDLGQAFLPVATTISGALNAIPAPALKAAADIALFAGAIKTASIAGNALSSLGTKLAASLVENTAASSASAGATQRETIALQEGSVAANAYAASIDRAAASLAAMTGIEGYAARSAAAQTGVDAVGMAGYEARTAAAAEAGLGARALGGAATGLSAAGSYVLPITIAVAATYAIAKGGEALGAWIDRTFIEQAQIKHEEEVKVVVKMAYTSDPQQRQAARDYLVKEQTRLQNEIALMESSGLAKSSIGSTAYAKDRTQLASVTTALAASSPESVDANAVTTLRAEYDALNNEVARGRMTMDQAQTTARIYAERLLFTGASVNSLNDAYIDEESTLKNLDAQRQHSIEVANQEARAADARANQLRAAGASESLIAADASGDKTAKRTADYYLKVYSAQEKALQQHYATMRAETEEAGKALASVDLSKGFAGVVKALPGLEQASLDLRALGASAQSIGKVDDLVRIGQAFKNLSDQFNASSAMTHFQGDTAMLGVTDQSISVLDSFAKRVKDVAQNAKDMQAHGGIVTPDQVELIRTEGNILDTIASQVHGLKANEASDILDAARHLPDMVKYNDEVRKTVAMFGGNYVLQARMQLDTQEAVQNFKNVQSLTKDLATHPEFIQLGIKDEQVKADISAAKGDIAALTDHDWAVIVQSELGTGPQAVAAYKAILDAVPRKVTTTFEYQINYDYQAAAGRVGANLPGHLEDLVGQQQINHTQVITYKARAETTDAEQQIHKLADPQTVVVSAEANTLDAENQINALTRPRTVTINVETSGSVPSGGGGGGAIAPYAHGGDVTGDMAIVGDTPDGDMSAAEVVDFRHHRVISHANAMRMGLLGRGMPRYAGGTDPYSIDATTGSASTPGEASWDGAKSPYSSVTRGAHAATGATKQLHTAVTQVSTALVDVSRQTAVWAGYLETLSPTNLKAVTSEFDHQFQMLTKINTAHLGPKATQAQRDAATQQALVQSVDVAIAFSRALSDAQNPANNLAADFEKIRDTGTPTAENLIRQVSIMREIAISTGKIKADQAAITSLEQANTQRKQQEAEADKQASRRRQEDQWAAQAVQAAEAETYRLQQEGFTNRRTAENDAWTVESRQIEDRRRALQFTQQVQATDLQNRLTDLQKSQQSQVYQRTSQEQLVAAQVKGAATNQQAATLAASLAAMHDADLARRDANTKAIDDLQMQIREEQKKANLDSYNLETERLKETRAHEDRLHRIDVEARAVDRAYQARQRAEAALATQQQIADTRAQWRLQDIRQKEDEKYTADKAAADAQLKSDQGHLTNLQDQLTQAQTVESLWEKIYQYVGASGNALLTAFTTIPASGPGFSSTRVRTLGNVPGHAAGTLYSDAGLARVNEEGGELRVLQSGEAILPADQTRALLREQGGQGGTTFNMPITITGGISEGQIEDLTRQFNAAIRAAVREMRQGNRSAMRAQGVA